jgi:hypothetical protein
MGCEAIEPVMTSVESLEGVRPDLGSLRGVGEP